MERLNTLAQHLTTPTSREAAVGDSSGYGRKAASLDDVVIVAALRTPMTKARRGGLKDTSADDLAACVLNGVMKKTGIDPQDVGDIVFGSVLGSSSQRAVEVRIGAFFAGFPESVPVQTVNRQCSSGLQAIATVAASIKAGFYTIGIGGGVETMSRNPLNWEGGANPRVQELQQARDALLPMGIHRIVASFYKAAGVVGITSENVAARFGVSREAQDAFAVKSHRKAASAQMQGKFRDEIIPVHTKVTDKESKESRNVVVDTDDGIRAQSSVSSLARLPPAFKKDGSTTAGNSSQVTDGASAVVLTTRREALRRQLEILGIFRSFAVVGVDPAVMGIGPAVAIPAALKKASLSLDDIDLFEINEAFASQATYCIKKLGIDEAKVNVNGGAIALGHPLGMTGARCTATLLHEMKRQGRSKRFGIVSMCIGSGMGAAAVFESGPERDPFTNAAAIDSQTQLSRDVV